VDDCATTKRENRVHEEHIRRWFDDELAAIAHGIQRDAGRIEFDRIVALAITFVLPLLAAGVAAMGLLWFVERVLAG